MLDRLFILLAGVLSLCLLAFICSSFCVDEVGSAKDERHTSLLSKPPKFVDEQSASLAKSNKKIPTKAANNDAPVVVEIIKTPEAELHLVGTIASNQERLNFIAALQRMTKDSPIHDNLSVATERSVIESARMHAVLPIIKAMKSGVISFWEERINITAVVDTSLEKDLLEEDIGLINWQNVELTKKIIVMKDERSAAKGAGQNKKAQVCQDALDKQSQRFSIEFTKVGGIEKLKENAVLQEFLNTILSCREHLIVIEGHYANSKNSKVNQQQSERFATEVLKYFQTHSSQALNLIARGNGDTAPLYDNSTKMGKAINRRIEFKVKEQ